jgi:hypothetical protein
MSSDLFLANQEVLFSLSSGIALLAWLALAASPHSARRTPRVRLIAGQAVPLVFATLYVALFATAGMGDGGYDSLASVQRLFQVPGLLLAGWLHYLAFDLFVGAWIADRAGALGMPQLAVLPLLGLTFLFGPAGLLAFALLRMFWLRRTRALPAAPSPWSKQS